MNPHESMSDPRRAWLAHAAGRPPTEMARSCAAQLDGVAGSATFGLLFIADPATEMADEMLQVLRACLPEVRWFGACGPAVIADSNDIADGGVAVLCLDLPSGCAELIRTATDAKTTLARRDSIVHLACAEHQLPLTLPFHAENAIGGATASQCEASLLMDRPVAGGGIAIAFRPPIRLITGMTGGTRDLGPWRRVTSSIGNTIIELDNRPAARVVEEDTGELLSRAPDRLVRQVIVETTNTPEPGSGNGRMALIERFDRALGHLVVRDPRPGSQLRLVHRQANSARSDMEALVASLLAEARSDKLLAAVLYSSQMRGSNLFGPAISETSMLRASLGNIPLIGLRTADELFAGQLTCGTAVLGLLALTGGAA